MSFLQEYREQCRKREDQLRSELKRIVNELVALGAKKVILFGSLVTGDIRPWSDIDLLVILPDDTNSKQWRDRMNDAVVRRVACDILIFNERELEADLPVSSFLREVVSRGEVLYEQ